MSGDFWGSQEGCQGPSRPSGRNRGLPLRRRRGQGPQKGAHLPPRRAGHSGENPQGRRSSRKPLRRPRTRELRAFFSCILIFQEAGQVVWYSHLFQNFPQFIVIHTVKGFGILNKAEIDGFLELSCFFDNPADAGKEGPQLASTGPSQGFPRAAAPVGVFSRGTTRISGSLSCGAREVRSPCAWRGY